MQFDAYPSPPSFSDASSTPRTPSPHASDFLINPKHNLPIRSLPHIFQDSDVLIHNDPAWFPYSNQPNSLLQELYEQDSHDNYAKGIYIDDSAHYTEWHNHQQQHHLHVHPVPRRATYPYVRHDLPQPQYYDQYPIYSDPPIPDRADPQPIKLEDTPLIVPSQLGFPTHPLQAHHHHHPSFHPSAPVPTVPVQLTDDAASKETQYLRRRCFNCHTTEPPSWRRSTLNPGKIVCNKCGLYERTHLRPRPLRFDELRAGGKTRKATGVTPADKKTLKSAPVVASLHIKNEPSELGLTRRNSVSSTASSDWDDSISVCSSQPPTPGSASSQSSAFSSPAFPTFPIPRSSQSPPVDSGLQAPIRLPNAPLTDIASLQQSHSIPRKAVTTPNYYPQPAVYHGQSENFRRGSLPLQQRNAQFASPPMPSQSPAPMHTLTPDASLQASPLPHASPLLLSSSSLVADLPSS